MKHLEESGGYTETEREIKTVGKCERSTEKVRLRKTNRHTNTTTE